MSYNRTFSQPAFWDFVASIRGRDSPNSPAYEPVPDAAPSWGGARGGRRGFGRRNRNGQAMTPAPTSGMEATPSTLAGNDNETEMPPAYPMETGTVPVTYENEKADPESAPLEGGNKRGFGNFHRLRMRLRQRGLPEEEINARIEKRRARRDALSEEERAALFERRRARRAARANGEGFARGPRARRMRNTLAEEDPLNTGAESDTLGETRGVGRRGQGFKRGNGHGPRGGCGKRFRSANPVDATASAEVPIAAETSAPATGERCGIYGRGGLRGRGRGHHGPRFEQHVRLQDIVKGGPAKFAGRFPPQGANPSNGNEQQSGEGQAQGEFDNTEDCGNRRGMRQGMRGLSINDAQDEGDATAAPALCKRDLKKMKKMNKHNGVKKDKSFTPRADVFSTAGSYVIHVALPGAKQENVAVTWNPEKSAIHIAGMIERPAPEELGKECTLVRGQRVIGSFERKIKLGKKREDVKVYENGITAILEDGILNIEVPNYDGADDEDMENGEGFVEINEKV